MGNALKNPPRIFHVNWFRQDAAGKFLWPGFGENLRVLSWILDRCAQRINAVETPIGFMPGPSDLNTQGLNITPAALEELTAVPREAWRQEVAELRAYLRDFGARLPAQMTAEVDALSARVG
jgi:phosphoenolpyruvate carboxykinase (GTP)